MDSGSLLTKAKTNIKSRLVINALLLLTLAFFVWLMVRITVPYIPYNTDVGFLQIKQDYIDIDIWRYGFFVHVYLSIWALLAGFTQFSKTLRAKNPKLHRWFGYIYSLDVLLAAGPSGLLIGIYANGGITSKVAFVTLAVLWIFTTAMAVKKAKEGDYDAHRDFMIRSYALTLSALTLRAWKWSINNSVDDLPPMDVYRAVAWLGWVPNLLIAEFIIWRYKYQVKKKLSEIKASRAANMPQPELRNSEI